MLGPGNYITKNRQEKGDKKDLDYLNKGGHLSVGLTKKRQEAYDSRDKKIIESRINKNLSNNKKNHYESKDSKRARKIKKKKLYQMSNDELRTLNTRQELESKYKKNNPSNIAKGILIVGATVTALDAFSKLDSHANRLKNFGKKVVNKIKNKIKNK